jgi:hypothetical protein
MSDLRARIAAYDARPLRAWAVEVHCRNRLDGDRRHLMWDHEPSEPFCYRLFRTRQECRAWIDKHHGYLRDRPDLRAEPFGWRMPQAVRVEVNRTVTSTRETP